VKILVRKAPLRVILQWTQRVLFGGATLTLAYCAFVLVDSWMFQHRQEQNLERLRAASAASPVSLIESAESPSPPPATANSIKNSPGGLIGRIEILRLGVSVLVVEGSAKSTLRRAAGHIIGTALPGQPGNIGVSAHRDTFFRPLRNIQHDDIITFATASGDYRYRVVSTTVVSPNNVAVLGPDGTEILTLVTCYPFYFVGAAPKRFIVRAARIL
jgi:sortase A